MPTRRFTLLPPQPFELAVVARSHGWYGLPPFRWDDDRAELSTAVALDEDRAVVLRARQSGAALACAVDSAEPIGTEELRRCKALVASMLRLDQDFGEFYELAAGDDRLRWVCERGAGRILRAPTAFEDLIKIVCTTNCSWSLTEIMVGNMVARCGVEAPDSRRAFPTPAALARKRPAFFRDVVRAGYRAPHFARLARDTARGAIELEPWRDGSGSTEELRARLLALPGVGPYAAAHLLRLSGHYADHGLDSWCRGKWAEIYGKRKPPADDVIVRRYRRFGRWLGLALWMDLTREWHVGGQ